MTFLKFRKDDRRGLKYLLPYGYMRRHLAKAYGFKVENGDFVKARILESDIKGFHLIDILPLGFVMALQRCSGGSPHRTDPLEEKIGVLRKDVELLRRQFAAYRANSECEIERLSVECMRLQLFNEQKCLDECHTSGEEKD